MSFWRQGTANPKRKFRFMVTINGAGWGSGVGGAGELWYAKSCTAPSVEVTAVEHMFSDHVFNFPGRAKWGDVEMVLVDPAGGGTGPGSDPAPNTVSNFNAVLTLLTLFISLKTFFIAKSKLFFFPAHLDEKIPGAPLRSFISNPESSDKQIKLVFFEKYEALINEFSLKVFPVSSGDKILNSLKECLTIFFGKSSHISLYFPMLFVPINISVIFSIIRLVFFF